MKSRVVSSVLSGLVVLLSCNMSQAAIIDYSATWSGAAFGNNANANAIITVDTSLLANPGNNDFFSSPGSFGAAITNVVLTVSGASAGNGTFTNADFSFYVFNWNTALNLNAELVGQPQNTGGPWGTNASQAGWDGSHDFNLFAATVNAPNGTFYYELTTNGGFGDSMYLTSFAPVDQAVPEPTTLALFCALSFGVFGFGRRDRMKD